ncbi:MAG: hypothetical protein JNL80_01160 [Phycisphaerae bacterium]|jgi:hypothetical protein|nr:hypothetical protein [Phycisphaerae bacterium]
MWPLAIVGASVLALAAMTVASRRPAAARPSPPAFVRASLFALILFAPYSWLLVIDNTDESYRRTWLELWPVLPGLPAMVVGRMAGVQSELGERCVAGGMTVILYALLLVLSGRGRWWFVTLLCLVVAYGVFMGQLSYAIFLM